MNLILGIVIGLVVGWNFFPQPTIVAEKIAYLKGKMGF